MLRLLKLSSVIKKMVNENKLSYGQARTLLSVEDEDEAIDLANRAYKEGLTVRQLEKITQKKEEKPAKPKERDLYLENVRNIIQNKLNTSVELSKHKLTISFNDSDDLNRILEIIGCLDESI